MADDRVSLDQLAANIVRRSGYRFTVAGDEATRSIAYRLRYAAVVEQQWRERAEFPDGQERDAYDDRAVQVIGWEGDTPMATGRIVLPPGSLPTEDACRVRVEPVGGVADVGRMVVARSHQGPAGHSAFLALLAALYLEVRDRHFEVACGVMSPRARSLVRLLGLRLDMLGDDRLYWGEFRAPVRFEVTLNTNPLVDRWQS